jgi:hypothetical protein
MLRFSMRLESIQTRVGFEDLPSPARGPTSCGLSAGRAELTIQSGAVSGPPKNTGALRKFGWPELKHMINLPND